MRKAVGRWVPETVKKIRPIETRMSLEEQLENAEKTFLSEARVVSTGRGDLENLEPFLSDIKRIRRLIEEKKRMELTRGCSFEWAGSAGSIDSGFDCRCGRFG